MTQQQNMNEDVDDDNEARKSVVFGEYQIKISVEIFFPQIALVSAFLVNLLLFSLGLNYT